mmetsp:Transcript_40878/g.66481  ORF Transcript_40878/g.66481 Transcript_40878/m.66481 type:complete len:81 (+) Transcript_40878:784-1026(+)
MMCSPQAPSEEIKMVEKAQTGDEADSEEESQAVKEPSVECDQGDIAQGQYARYTHSKLRQKDKQQECGDEKRHFVRHLSS